MVVLCGPRAAVYVEGLSDTLAPGRSAARHPAYFIVLYWSTGCSRGGHPTLWRSGHAIHAEPTRRGRGTGNSQPRPKSRRLPSYPSLPLAQIRFRAQSVFSPVSSPTIALSTQVPWRVGPGRNLPKPKPISLSLTLTLSLTTGTLESGASPQSSSRSAALSASPWPRRPYIYR